MSLIHFLKYKINITNHNIDRVYKEEEPPKNIKAKRIRQSVSLVTGIPFDVIDAKTRKREIVEARQLCHYFAYYYKFGSLQQIADEFGKKDHATVLHSVKTVRNLYETNKEYLEKFNIIKQLIEKR